MLVYEKKVEEVSKIFGTMGNIPSDDDEEVIYKDSDGQEIIPALTLNVLSVLSVTSPSVATPVFSFR